jgi:hypothetical protein
VARVYTPRGLLASIGTTKVGSCPYGHGHQVEMSSGGKTKDKENNRKLEYRESPFDWMGRVGLLKRWRGRVRCPVNA